MPNNFISTYCRLPASPQPAARFDAGMRTGVLAVIAVAVAVAFSFFAPEAVAASPTILTPPSAINWLAASALVTPAAAIQFALPPDAAESEPNAETTPAVMVIEGAQILPMARRDESLPTVDGRQFFVRDMEALARSLNSAAVKVRLDTDHRTEPAAYGWRNEPVETRAEGWLMNWRAAGGKLLADIEVNNVWTAEAIRSRGYRYLSPALTLNDRKEVVGVTSVGLTNRPNLKLKALNNTEVNTMPETTEPATPAATPTATETELNTLREKVAAQELALAQTAADAAINAAVQEGKVAPAEKDSLRDIALNHKDGYDAGLSALNGMLATRPAGLAELQKKVAPTILTPNGGGAGALTLSELQACRLCAVSPEAFRQMKKDGIGAGGDTRKHVADPFRTREAVAKEIITELNVAGQSHSALNATGDAVVLELNAAAATPALIGDLTRIFSNEFNTGFARPKMFWNVVAMEVRSTGKGNVYGYMNDLKEMREWTGDRTVDTVESVGKSLDNKNYELTIGLDLNDIDDDNVMVYMPRLRRLGEAAATKMDDLVRDVILAADATTGFDGQYFFDTDHPTKNAAGAAATYSNRGTVAAGKSVWVLLDLSREYKPFIMQIRKDMTFVSMDSVTDEQVFTSRQLRYGVDCRMAAGYGLYQLAYLVQNDLTGANFETAVKAMRGQLSVTDGSRPLGINPTHILIDPALEFTARELFKQPGNDGTEDNKYYNRVEIVDTDWLSGADFS